MTTVVVLQPGYLPWLGFFEQMLLADVFVYYDDVAFDKHGWRNRNRIKGPNGPLWLTVPVRHAGRGGQRVADVEIDAGRPWAKKHERSIRQSYARAPHLEPYASGIATLLHQDWRWLADLDMAVVALMCRWLGLSPVIRRSSDLGVTGERSQRLVGICRMLGADTYLSGATARNYLDVPLFEKAGIAVRWQDYNHPIYTQLHGPFVSHLSVLDLVLNVGPESGGVIRGRRPDA